MSKIVIAMPTYNEAKNIGRMIDTLVGKVFPKIKNHQMMLLVVDDSSPDGTGEIVKKKQAKYKNLYLLTGNKEGLGAAYTRGFHYAIDKLKADAVMEMDADFQHNPNDVPRFVAEFDNGYDYVIGSRLIAGGSIPANWRFKRKFLSIGGSLFARATLWVWEVHDFTTGFRLARVKGFLDQINFEKVFSKSYAYKIRLLYEMKRMGAKIKEIPIKFIEREKGWSKMEGQDFFESLKVIGSVWKERLSL